MAEVRLSLRGFHPIPGDKARRYQNKRGDIISLREFQQRAKREVVEPKPKPRKPTKPRETVRRLREKWYANRVNRQAWLRSAPQDAYISYQDAGEAPDFVMYENLIRSPDRDIREVGYEFFRELEWEYENVPWGDT